MYMPYCVACKGAATCAHAKRVAVCTECNKHRRYVCNECPPGRATICRHRDMQGFVSKIKECRECSLAFCMFGTWPDCDKCAGTFPFFCKHDKDSRTCHDCGGADFCDHGFYLTQCQRCTPPVPPAPPACRLVTSRRSQRKETVIVDSLRNAFPHVEMILDKRVGGPCASGKRPDIRIEKYLFSLLVEVDEHQHRRGSYHCEEKRQMQLFMDAGNRPMVIIRFNPDNYIERSLLGGTVRHKGIFKSTAMGLTTDKDELARRMTRLIVSVDKWLRFMDVPLKELTVEELFYSTPALSK